MTFGAHKLVHSQLFFWTTHAKFDTCYQRYVATCGKNFIQVHIYNLGPKLLQQNFFSKPSAIYTKWCAQTFPPIFGLFAIFDHNLAKIVAAPSDECENCVPCLKVQSLPKKTIQTASKSAYKRQRNACSNYAPLERTVLRTRSVTKKQKKNKKTNTTFSHLQPARVVDLPQTLHVDRARRAHQKKVSSIFRSNVQFFLQGARKNLA